MDCPGPGILQLRQSHLPMPSPRSEDQDRHDLSLAFRLAERFGFHEGICNHFSVRLDTEQERYLINPYGVHWSCLQPDSLLLIDGDGQVLAGDGAVESTALFIHVASHRANPRHKAVLHTHMPYATTLTMLAGEAGSLSMTHQTAVRFHGRIAHEPAYGGLALDQDEGERISQRAGAAPEVDIVFLANHGVVVSGNSVALAFDDLYYLERACRQQVMALQTGQPLKPIPEAVVEHTANQMRPDLSHYAEKHFRALEQVLLSRPDFHFTF